MDRAELIDVLGVSDSPTTGELRLARRRAARRLHPDAVGDQAAEVMAQKMSEVNEACDRWIDEIRTTRDAPTVSMPASFVQQRASTPRARASAPPGRAGGLQPVYALATIALMVVIMGVIVLVAGPSVASVAIGALFGAAGGAIYLLILRGLVGSER